MAGWQAACLVAPLGILAANSSQGVPPDRPNILWLTSEDNSPNLGCYGDPRARTPWLDALAREGVRFRNAFSPSPVCSPARSTLITGMNATTLGIHDHRSRVRLPESVVFLNGLLREAGYYCTNNAKTDYNGAGFAKDGSGDAERLWHENGESAHYRHRPKGVPFFAVFNTLLTHEGEASDGQYLGRKAVNPPERIVPPESVLLPPYHPDTPAIRENWSRYFDNVWLMDRWVGETLAELEASGEAGNTIVFYFSDHGGALAGGKRSTNDAGTRVPLVVRFPEKWRHLAPAKPGAWVDGLVTFVDVAATTASLAGIEVPRVWEGTPFAGPRAGARGHVVLFRGRMDERSDTVRAIRTREHLYVKNFSPHRPMGQPYAYPFRVLASMRSWHEVFRKGLCDEVQARYWLPKDPEELYVVVEDPFQTRNRMGDPDLAEVAARLRALLKRELIASRDPGLVPEGMRARLAEGTTIHEVVRGAGYSPERVAEAAFVGSARDASRLDELRALCASDDGVLRSWGATGALVLGESAAPMKEALLRLLGDPVLDVRVVAAEALGHLGEAERAAAVLAEVAESGNEFESLAALGALDALGRTGILPRARVEALFPKVLRGDGRLVAEAFERVP